MNIQKVYSSPNCLCDVLQDAEGRMYLVALCAGIAWSRVGLVMSIAEVEAFRTRPAFAEELGLQMCKNFDPFRRRAISDSVRDAIFALD
jgi:hypothetical protein